MGSGADTKTGAFIGTGATLEIATVGFKPRSVRLYNMTDPGVLVWIEPMDDAAGFKQVDGTMTALTSLGITPTDEGFTLGADTDMNVSGEQVFYECAK